METGKNNRKQWEYQSFELEGFKDITLEEKLKRARDFGRKAQESFDTKYKSINEWFTSDFDQLYLLSFCARYFLMHEEGYDEELEKGEFSFAPHYLEILQAISLAHDRVYSAKPLWEDTERLMADMKEVGKLIQYKLMNLPPSIETMEQLSAYKVRTDVMGYSLAVRNWAYIHQMHTVTSDVASLVKDAFVSVYSVEPTIFIDLLFRLCEETENRVNNHVQRISTALQQKDHILIQKKYQELFQTKETDDEDMNRFWEMVGHDMRNLRALLLAHSDLKLDALFTYTLDELYTLSNSRIEKDHLGILFDKISYAFGDLKDFTKEFIIFDNPVHNKPFIKLENEQYFTSLWISIPHLSLSVLEHLIAENNSLTKKYNDQRGWYLEDQVAKLFEKSFPNAQIHRGSKYGDNYENDLLVIIDSFALVVEAKGGTVTKSAKRGAPERLFGTIKKLVEEPSEQAHRFINHLKNNPGVCEFITKKGRKNFVDTTDVKYYIPLGVTFYHLGVVGTNLKLLTKGRITERPIHELAPSISFTDLQIIFDVLTSEVQIIHYLHRRREFETQVDYFADELDLLGFYLNNGFNLGDLDNNKHIVLDASLNSKILDPYYIAISQGKVPPVKPELQMTAWWKGILGRLGEQRPHKWIELSYVLLNLNEWAQKELESGFMELCNKIKLKQVNQKHNWVIFNTAKEDRRYTVVAYPYLNEHRAERDNMITTIMEMVLDETPMTKGIVVIGVNIDQGHYPYSVLAGELSSSLFDDQFSGAASQTKNQNTSLPDKAG